MNLTALQTAVLTRLGRPSTDGYFTTAVLTDLINEALQAISDEAEWPWLQTSEVISTVAGTSNYTPNANWNFTKTIFIDQFVPLSYTPLEDLVSIGTVVLGQPSLYTIAENQIKVRTVPDSIYAMSHIYYKIEPTLSSGSDTPLMPSQFQYAIVALAVVKAYQRINDPGGAAEANGEYRDWLRRLNKYRRRSSGPLKPKRSRWR